MRAYVFPGQGSQFPGMGRDIYQSNEQARHLMDSVNAILGLTITDVMFDGTPENLKQTKVTQPAIFLHSITLATVAHDFKPEMVAGHSLGEFSALVANGSLSFEDGLKLVFKRARAMQKACELNPSTMAAIIGLDDHVVEEICDSIDEVVVPANYNSPGQLVISGSIKGIDLACEKMKEAGAKRALPLPVGGAFHSPLMESAKEELATAIESTTFEKSTCPVYQNVTASASSDVTTIKNHLIDQLTSPVRWTQSVQNMVKDGATTFIKCGPGKILQGLVRKIHPEAEVSGI